MFSRSSSMSRRFSREEAVEDPQVSTLYKLGLLTNQERRGAEPSPRRSHSERQQPGVTIKPVPGEVQFPEKNKSIAAGTITGPLHRSSPSINSVRSNQSSASHRKIGAMASILSGDRGRSRRERTFVGSECAVCEEPLEHTLRGERILQFSCGHVSHEACFYEYMRDFDGQYCPTCNAPLHLDTSRGGNVLDIEKISNLVRAAAANGDGSSRNTPTPTATAWDTPAAMRSPSNDPMSRPLTGGRDTRSLRDSGGEPPLSGRLGSSRHMRSDSEVTGGALSAMPSTASVGGYSETAMSGGPPPPIPSQLQVQQPPPSARLGPRPHEYDVQMMETAATPLSPRTMTRNPIPPPTVTVRSEFPTVNRSRQQQTITCLVTVEVPEGKWRPDPEDVGGFVPHGALMPTPGGPPPPVDGRPPSPARSVPRFYPYESPEVLEEMTENLRNRVDNWHGLDFSRFGKLRLYGTLKVGKDKISWQELECYLFAEMLICVKEKKQSQQQQQQQSGPEWDDRTGATRKTSRCTLKGSILIKKHLNEVTDSGTMDENILTLSLSVAELPQFHLKFDNRNQLKLWNQALLDLNAVEVSPVRSPEYDRGELSETDDDEWQRSSRPQRVSSMASSSWGGPKSVTTAPTEYTNYTKSPMLPSSSLHVPIDVVVVIPISSSMQGVKINLVRDALRFMVATLGERDRMGLVTFGSGGGGVPIVGMTTKAWPGWGNVLASIKPVGQKSHRADVVEGANVAMDLLMQRKFNNPIATIMLISDASTSDADSVDFVVSRAEAAKITIHSFGLGMTHKPDTMIELSTRTKASYTYVKDWMMLRECLAGCLGAMQTLSHQNVKLKLKLPEGSPAKFHKISGALQITKRATGRDAEALLGDLRFGDKRDVLVQLIIMPDNTSQEQVPQDAWETIVSGLEALGGPSDSDDSTRVASVEEVPLIQADLVWGDILRDGTVAHMPRPSLLAITMLPPAPPNRRTGLWNGNGSVSPAIPPHQSIVQRRMELLTSDMLTRALTLVTRGQHDRAHTLLTETRSILKGLGKGGLPPVPSIPAGGVGSKSTPTTPHPGGPDGSPTSAGTPDRKRTPSPATADTTNPPKSAGLPQHAMHLPPHTPHGYPPLPSAGIMNRSRSSETLATGLAAQAHHNGTHNATLGSPAGGTSGGAGIDPETVAALIAELDSALEWIQHPAVFSRDSRKAVLQAIGVISSQRAMTFRTPIETLWASRLAGVRRLTDRSREWREEGGGDVGILEEA